MGHQTLRFVSIVALIMIIGLVSLAFGQDASPPAANESAQLNSEIPDFPGQAESSVPDNAKERRVIRDAVGRATPYSTDGKRVFFDGRIVADADPTSFQIMDFPDGTLPLYARDGTNVFFGSLRIPGADPRSFSTLLPVDRQGGRDLFAKDRWHVYLFEFPIEEADPETFISLGKEERCGAGCLFDAYDAAHRYNGDQIVGQP